MLGVLMGSTVNKFDGSLYILSNSSYLNSTGLAQGKKSIQECKKFCRNQLKLDLRQ